MSKLCTTIHRRRLLAQAGGLMIGAGLGLHPRLGRAAGGRPDRVVRVGYLGVNPPVRNVSSALVFLELEKLGYIEGRDVIYEIRDAGGHAERLPQAAAELVALPVDVIMAVTNPAIFAARNATSTIPIVAWAAHGAVETGLVSNLRRPGGNITGTESLAVELDAKRIELIRQIVPDVRQISVLADRTDQGSPHHLKSVQRVSREFGLTVQQLSFDSAADLDAVLAAQAGKPLGVLMPFTSNTVFRQWRRIRDFAMAQHLPTLCEFGAMARSGGLISYGPTFEEIGQRVAVQIDKILRGTPPGELPVERPTRFELVLNLQTARTLGLKIPEELLLRADEVIR